MKIVNLIDEDFCQYKKPSMFIGFPTCSFKCDKECGRPICQNSALAAAPQIEMDAIEIAKRYYENPITEAVVFGGLEPFDSFADMIELISHLVCCHTLYPDEPKPDIVIYTGYCVWEIKDKIKMLNIYKDMNIIIKLGRFVPDQKSHMDEILGVELASPNQYALPLKTIINNIDFFENIEGQIIEKLLERPTRKEKEEKTHENK